MERPLHIPVRPSRIAQRVSQSITLLALLAIWQTGLPVYGQCLLSMALIIYCYVELLSLRKPAVQTLVYADGVWQWQDASGNHACILGNKVYIGFGLVCLYCVLPTGKKMRVMLWPDSTASDNLRRLRVYLLQRAK